MSYLKCLTFADAVDAFVAGRYRVAGPISIRNKLNASNSMRRSRFLERRTSSVVLSI